MNTLLVVDSDAPYYAEILEKKKLPDLIINAAQTPQAAEEYLDQTNIILGQPAFVAPLLDQARSLYWVQSTFAGIEPLCAKDLRTDYLLTGVKGIFGPLMSEYVFAYILAQERNLFATRTNQKRRVWSPIPYKSLGNLTIGIIGLGSIGKHIAGTAAHFGMQVFGLKRTFERVDGVDRLFLPEEKSSFLPLIDYLVLTLPASDQTTRFLTLEDLELMKSTAIIMAVGRGSNIDQEGLITALQKKYIAGAVLDVFESEPLPESSPLWDMPNVYVTPHNSAFSFPAQVASLFCDNYARYISGKRLNYVIDFERGY